MHCKKGYYYCTAAKAGSLMYCCGGGDGVINIRGLACGFNLVTSECLEV